MIKTFRNNEDLYLKKRLLKALKQTKQIDFELGKLCHSKNSESVFFKKYPFPNKAMEKPVYVKSEFYSYQHLIEKELVKNYKRLEPRWNEFWDVVTDDNPVFCFITGNYIRPAFRNTLAVQPFKDGEWCFKYDYDKYLTHNVISDKLTNESMLICIATQSKTVRPYTQRPLIENNEEAIRKHLNALSQHYPLELTTGDTDWKILRAKYFLKPNGKRFPKVR